MRFNYPFQKIVDLKTSEKSQAEWLLSNALGHLRNEQSMLENLNTEQERLQQQLLEAAEQCCSVSNLRYTQRYIAQIGQQIVHKHQVIDDAQRTVERSKEVLTQKLMDEKIWEKAKEHALRKFMANMQTKAQNELDDLTSARFGYPN